MILSPLVPHCCEAQRLLGAAAESSSTSADLSPGQLGPPFLDKGRLCQEKMEVVQEVRFEKQIRCDIEMQEK